MCSDRSGSVYRGGLVSTSRLRYKDPLSVNFYKSLLGTIYERKGLWLWGLRFYCRDNRKSDLSMGLDPKCLLLKILVIFINLFFKWIRGSFVLHVYIKCESLYDYLEGQTWTESYRVPCAKSFAKSRLLVITLGRGKVCVSFCNEMFVLYLCFWTRGLTVWGRTVNT